MHFEVLVEDKSGKKALDILVPKIVGAGHTFRVLAYKGIGHIPKDLKGTVDPKKRMLLNELPRLLRGYGKASASCSGEYRCGVVVVCDLDAKCFKVFRKELLDVLHACNPQPEARFCFAIEEGEAWLLGDIPAVKTAYPMAKEAVLDAYVNDAICGTWERLAEAIHRGGAAALSADGWQAVGARKAEWADAIAPHMDVENNASPSFAYFRDKLRELARA
ncbi:MAG: hypothetical protein ACYCTF_10025 [Acidiferrobacter sp.]